MELTKLEKQLVTYFIKKNEEKTFVQYALSKISVEWGDCLAFLASADVITPEEMEMLEDYVSELIRYCFKAYAQDDETYLITVSYEELIDTTFEMFKARTLVEEEE